MIDPTHPLPVAQQCQLLGLSRSTAYYQPRPGFDTALTLMHRIDELHLHYPFAEAQMLRDLLRREGHTVGRRHVATLMRRMGITAVYRLPRTSQRHPTHHSYPYLLRELDIVRPTTSGRWISPTFPCGEASSISSLSWTERVAECWPGGSRIH
jgi:putative transposase